MPERCNNYGRFRAGRNCSDLDQGQQEETRWAYRHEGRDHYSGASNKSVRIKQAEVLRKNFQCKNERAISLEKILANMQLPFSGYSDNDEAFQ
jgi:hypothetical protein